MFYEIYLTKAYIKNWNKLIEHISYYTGYLKKWKIIIENNNNHIHYYIKTNCTLMPTINNSNDFLIKEINEIKIPNIKLSLISLKNNYNTTDLINYYEIKNKGTIKYIEITFRKITKNIIKSNIYFYLKNHKYKIFSNPNKILSIDFENNKRYFYKKTPKYLDINKILHLLNTDLNNSLLKVDTFPYIQGNFYLSHNNFNFDKHSIIVGSSGSGKSKLLSLLINNVYKTNNQKYKFVIIDPHAALIQDIGGISNVIDFKSNSINLFINNIDNITSTTELLIDLFKNIINDQYNSKLERVLRHSIYLLLSNNSFNFINLKNILLDIEYRNELINEQKDKIPLSIIDFFLSDFNDLKTKSYGEAISPIISFIDEMEMIPVFNSKTIENTLKDSIEDNYITLISLDRINLGDKITKTISGLVMQQLLNIIQTKEIKEHIIFVVDEVATIENPILTRYLSESRKYNLSLILISQYFNQITESLRNAIFSNVINYFIFRVSRKDASSIVENINMKIPLDDSLETKVKLLTELNLRECIVRIEANDILLPAFKAKTLEYLGIPKTKQINKQHNNIKEPIKTFNINTNINLSDILKNNSTERKKENE